MKEPKRWICKECGFKSNRHKTLDMGMVGFAICFKCRGRVKETEEWKAWYHDTMDKWRKSFQA